MRFKWNLSGKKGEEEAVKYLEKKGYTIIKTNYSIAGAEIDIIAEKENTISFIEVKTRKNEDYGLPEEFVNKRKGKRIIRAAKLFLGIRANSKYDKYYKSFDIISIIYGEDKYEIEHYIGILEET